MKMLPVIILCVLLGLSPAGAASLSVVELAVTTKISKGKPIDAVHRISYRHVKELFCYTRTVSKTAGPTSIKHIWKRDGKVVKEATMAIKAKQWRAYSTLPVKAASKGNWRVEVLDEAGEQVRSIEFLIH